MWLLTTEITPISSSLTFLLYTFATDSLFGLLQSSVLPLSYTPVLGFCNRMSNCVCASPGFFTWGLLQWRRNGVIHLRECLTIVFWCFRLSHHLQRQKLTFWCAGFVKDGEGSFLSDRLMPAKCRRSCKWRARFLNMFQVEWDEIQYVFKLLCSKNMDLHLTVFLFLSCIHKRATIFTGREFRWQNQWEKEGRERGRERRRKVDWFSAQPFHSKSMKDLLWKIFARMNYFGSL